MGTERFGLEVWIATAFTKVCDVVQTTSNKYQRSDGEFVLKVNRLNLDSVVLFLYNTLPTELGVFRLVWPKGLRYIEYKEPSAEDDTKLFRVLSPAEKLELTLEPPGDFLRTLITSHDERNVAKALREAIVRMQMYPYLANAVSDLVEQAMHMRTIDSPGKIVPTVFRLEYYINERWYRTSTVAQTTRKTTVHERAAPFEVIVLKVQKLNVHSVGKWLQHNLPRGVCWRLQAEYWTGQTFMIEFDMAQLATAGDAEIVSIRSKQALEVA